MADISQINVNNTTYDIKDVTARQALDNLPGNVATITQAEIDAGTSTDARTITPKILKDNLTQHTHTALGDSTTTVLSVDTTKKSVVEGNTTTASGNYSHAEGEETTASGTNSHAEGCMTTASNFDSHAEGISTIASGDESHAEGIGSIASGSYSHAQNEETIAASDSQTALGRNNIEDANSTYAVIVGNGADGDHRSNALAIDWLGNAYLAGTVKDLSGNNLIPTVPSNLPAASGGTDLSLVTTGDKYNWNSKANSSDLSNYLPLTGGTVTGDLTVSGTTTLGSRLADSVVGANSHAEGVNVTASGNSSHAEGRSTVSSSSSSHAEGRGTTASGSNGSHAEGYVTEASGGDGSHAEGNSTTASGAASHAEGVSTTASGQASHAEGENTTASGVDSHAEGDQTTASGIASHAEGTGTIAASDNQTVIGKYNVSDSKIIERIGDGNTITFSLSPDITISQSTDILKVLVGEEESEYTVSTSNNTITIDPAPADSDAITIEVKDNKYAVIVGNGTADNTRSNAFTVDWTGNLNVAGNITSNGQVLTPTTVGTSGQILQSNGNNAPIWVDEKIQATSNPTSGCLIWIDTSE